MIGAALNLALCIFGAVVMAIWICALVKWDGKQHCDGDCDHCPFPKCTDKKGDDDNE